MVNAQIFAVGEEHSGDRIEKIITLYCDGLSRSAAQKLIDEGNVTVNSLVITKNYKVRANDRVTVKMPEPKELEIF